MKLFIAEKTYMAKDITKTLVGISRKKDAYLESTDNVVTWCYGYLLKSIEPEVHNSTSAQWKSKNFHYNFTRCTMNRLLEKKRISKR